MVLVESGKNWKGEVCSFYMDGYLKKNLDDVKEVVTKKDWDYVAIITGNPGVGKSNFAQNIAKYCCPWFNEKYICFTAQEFIELTNSCPKNSSIILDESFASLNSKVSMTSEFVRIINHLQLIRQKNLFIFLCLPNFFDLAKGIAIYRAHHLFLCYGEKYGDRGRFVAFSRDRKKNLYILGSKFMNYNAVKGNFRGVFYRQKIFPPEVYDKKKLEHLKQQEAIAQTKRTKYQTQRDKLIVYLREKYKCPWEEIGGLVDIGPRQIRRIVKAQNET